MDSTSISVISFTWTNPLPTPPLPHTMAKKPHTDTNFDNYFKQFYPVHTHLPVHVVLQFLSPNFIFKVFNQLLHKIM